MSLINEYRATEEAYQGTSGAPEVPEQDDKLKKNWNSKRKLRTLMGTYQKSLRDVISCSIRTPRSARAPAPPRHLPASARKVKQYKNPHTGEVIETKGGNHKTLKEWKAEWGPEAVESWATLLG